MRSPLVELQWYAFAASRVIDGDTVEGVIDLGGGDHYPTHVRLANIDAPEMKRPTRASGDASKLSLAGLVGGGACEVAGVGTALDKYGRVVGWVRLAGGVDLLNDVQLALGFARPYRISYGRPLSYASPRPGP